MSKVVTFSVKKSNEADWITFRNRTQSGSGISTALMYLIKQDNARYREKAAEYHREGTITE